MAFLRFQAVWKAEMEFISDTFWHVLLLSNAKTDSDFFKSIAKMSGADLRRGIQFHLFDLQKNNLVAQDP